MGDERDMMLVEPDVKLLLGKMKELASHLLTLKRDTVIVLNKLTVLQDQPIGCIPEVRKELDFQHRLTDTIYDHMQKHIEVAGDLNVALAKAYTDWKKEHGLDDQQRQRNDAIPERIARHGGH